MFEFLRYCGVSFVGAAINYAVYVICLVGFRAIGGIDTHASMPIFLAVAAGSAIAMVFNFLGSRYIAFVKRESAHPPAP